MLGDAGDRLAQFAEPVLALDQLPENFALPFSGQNPQRAMKLRHQPALARFLSGNIVAFCNSHLFHTTSQKASYLCFSSYSRILCVESLRRVGHGVVAARPELLEHMGA